MSHLRPPVAVHLPEEWDWAAERPSSSAYSPVNRLADVIRDGLRAVGLDATYAVTSRPDGVFISRPSAATPRDRILISPGNPYRADEAWHAIDSETYDGAEDSQLRSHIGAGATPRQAALHLLGIVIESDYYDDVVCTALCAEIARRWP